MNGFRLRALRALLVCSSLAFLPFQARGQFSTPRLVEEIEPNAKPLPGSRREGQPAAPPPSREQDGPEAAEDPEINEEPVFVPGRQPADRQHFLDALPSPRSRPDAGEKGADAGSVVAGGDDAGMLGPAEGVTPGKAILLPPTDGDAQLVAAWRARLEALERRSFRAADEQESRLLSLRDELGYENLFAMSSAVALEAQAMLESDPVEAKRRALYAAALAPDLPYAHWMVATTAWKEDLLGVGQYLGATQRAIETSLHEPRWRSALLADAAAALFGAALLGALCVLLLVFGRHLRCLLHDVRHALPGGATRPQITVSVLLAVSAPALLGVGAFGLAAALVLGAWLYMNRDERLVLGAIVGLLGLLPAGAALVARVTSFAGTRAQAIYLVERGGLEGQQAALESLAEQANPPFEVAFAIGRQARRHGDVKTAIDWLRRAAEQRPTSPEALLELGNALLLFGDLDGARETYERALRLAPERGEAPFNLARLFARRSQLVSAEDASYELSHAQEYVRKTIAVDSRLGMAAAGEIDYRANRFLAAMPLGVDSLAELAEQEAPSERLKHEVARRLFGRVPAPLAPALSLAFAALLGALTLGGGAFGVSGRCSKCGRPACRRCDVEVSGPGLCGQCLYVFNQRGVVDPTARAEKEMGIQRHQKLRERTIKLLSLVLPGGGMVMLGRTARGTLTLVVVLLLAFPLAHGSGLVPVPAGHAPGQIKAAMVLLGGLIWAMSARSTFKALKGPAANG